MRHRSILLARLSLRRRALVYWAATALLAGLTAVLVGALVTRAERAAARYGDARPVLVAVDDLAPGDLVTEAAVAVELRPAALVPEDALSERPEGRTALAPIAAGEAIVPERLAPDGLTGVAALLPEGTRALAVPTGPGTLRLALGDVVDVLVTADPGLVEGTAGMGRTVASGATVVDVTEDTATVAVAQADAPAVAAALTQGTVTLALSLP